MHAAELNVTDPPLEKVKLSPTNVPEVEDTVAVQVVGAPASTEAGEHDSLVVVATTPDTTFNENAPLLALYDASPPNVAVIVWIPALDGMKVTEQLAPLTILHVAGLSFPVTLLAKLKLSPTNDPETEETVAVQVVGAPTSTEAGEHDSLVVVAAIATVIVTVPLLFAWDASPLKVAMIV